MLKAAAIAAIANKPNSQGCTPLILAATPEVVRLLVTYGAYPELVTHHQGETRCAIIEYCESNNRAALSVLLMAFDAAPNRKFALANIVIDGDTPLTVSAKLGHVGVVRELLRHGASIHTSVEKTFMATRVKSRQSMKMNPFSW